MFDANAFIEQAEQEIADLKRRSVYYRLGSYGMRVIAPALLFTGLIKGCVLMPDDPLGIFQHIGVSLDHLLGENIPSIWAPLWVVSPYPRMTPLVSLLSWMVWLGGLILLLAGLQKQADTLKADAAEARKTLKLQAPLLQAMAHAQSNRIGDVSGDQNVINAVNTINTILHQSKDQSSSGTAWGLIISIIGVVVNIISLFIH